MLYYAAAPWSYICWLIHFNHCKVVVFFICNSSQNKWCVYRAYCNIQHQHYTHCRHPSNINIIHIADIHPTSTLCTLQTSIQVEKIRVKKLSKWINKIGKTRKLNYHKFVKPGTKTALQNCAGNRFGEREKYVFLKNKSKNWSVSFNDGYNENEFLPKINHCDVTNVIIFTTKVIYKYWHIFSLCKNNQCFQSLYTLYWIKTMFSVSVYPVLNKNNQCFQSLYTLYWIKTINVFSLCIPCTE